MCGIVGYWALTRNDLPDEVMDRFTDSMAHRGPDSRGVWRNRKLGLSFGNRRLAGIDLSDRGRQPMSYAEGRYWINYNGTVYNYLEVREELKAKGHRFQSDTDTEVILAAYVEWGPKCQYKLNGDFAFAIWDEKEQTLFISRDQFGLKPFYYIATKDVFAFASELKAFLQIPSLDTSFNEDLVAETLTNINGLEGTDLTLLKQVKRLPGGHSLTMKPGQPPRIEQWWKTVDHLVEVPKKFDDQVAEFRELFFDSCRLRLRSNRPIVTNLSGGLDSSSVTSVMATLRKEAGLAPAQQRAYVARFPGTNQDEFEYAKAVVDYHQITPVYLDINVDTVIGQVDELIWRYEDIFWVLPVGQWLILKEMHAREGLVVTLDGGGGDDMLSSLSFFILDEMQRSLFLRFNEQKFNALKKVVERMAGGNDAIRTDTWYLFKRMMWQTPLGRNYVVPFLSRFTPATPYYFLKHQPHHRQLFYEDMASQVPTLTGLNRAHYWWFHHTGVPTIAQTYDRSATSHGVEVRAPFMDHRLVSYAFSLPDDSKVGNGYNKRILREAMKGLMPEQVRLRTSKIGFSSPMEQWLQGPLRPWLLDAVSSQEFLSSPIWDGPKLRTYVQDSVQKGQWSNLPKIWPFVQAYYFMKLFKDRKVTA